MGITRLFCIAIVAVAAIGRAQETAESQAESYARQGYELARRGSLAEAEVEMREAIRITPRNPLYHSALAGLLSKQNQLAKAKSELELALTLDPEPKARTIIEERLLQTDLILGASLARAARYSDGLMVAQDASKRFEQESRVWQMLGYFQQKLQLNRLAVASYTSAVRSDPGSAESNIGLGTAQFAAGMESEAVRTLEAGMVKFPGDSAHYEALGIVLLRLSESGHDTAARSRELFEKALRLDSSLSEAHYELGVSCLAENNVTAAKQHLLAAEASAPNDSRIHFALARLYRRQGLPANAEGEMREFERTKSDTQNGSFARLRQMP